MKLQDAGPLNDAMLESFGLSDLVPASLAKWRPLIFDGVRFFLERLRPDRQSAIMVAQFALPAAAEPAERLFALLTQCPTLHKLGQVVARHRQLPAELRHQLHALESLPCATPMAEVLATIRQQLPDRAPVTVATQALAEGSVAVVVPFTWLEAGTLRHGAFKVLKPHVEARLDEELAIWLKLGRYLETRSGELGLPKLDYRDTLDSVRELLGNEVRLEVEQANLAAAAKLYAHEPRVLVPALLPWSTRRMTAMERVFGTKVTDAPLSQPDRMRLADTMVSALIAQPFWSKAHQALIHADPHAGNLFATDDGRLGLLDWSLTARLTKKQREAIVDIALGGITLDASKMCRAVASLGTLSIDDAALVAAVRRALRRVCEPRLPGFDWMLALLDDVASNTEAGFRDQLILFRKSWLTLSGVIHDVAGDRSADRSLLGVGLWRFMAELPRRARAPFRSRRFDSHLSNAELAGLGLTLPLLPARIWLARSSDAWAKLVDSWRAVASGQVAASGSLLRS